MKEHGGVTAQERERLTKLAKSEDAKRLMELLGQSGGVKQAAKEAAAGNAGALMEMVNRLMSTREGADLVERINQKARENGLTD